MLTTNGRNYIARNFGVNNCFAASGVTHTITDINNVTTTETGATGQIVLRVISSFVKQVVVRGTVYTYAALRAANGADVDRNDVTWIVANDGSQAGEPKYCATATAPGPTPGPTPRPGPIATPTPAPGTRPTSQNLAGTFEFLPPPSGNPTVILLLTSIQMQQNRSDGHFEMNNVKIKNTSLWQARFAAELRIFTGAQTSCPSSGQVFRGLDRVSTTRKPRIKILDPGEEAELDIDVYQPSNLRGVHTICLYIHGTWNKEEMDAELALIPG